MFIQRESDRIQKAILDRLNANETEKLPELYAAHQALAWAGEPTGFKSPADMSLGGEGCPEPAEQPA